MSKETGGPAFPYSGVHKGEDANYIIDSHGMTLLDYFAAKAMQGYLANAWQAETLDSLGESAGEQMETVAEISYLMADAMLRARGQ